MTSNKNIQGMLGLNVAEMFIFSCNIQVILCPEGIQEDFPFIIWS